MFGWYRDSTRGELSRANTFLPSSSGFGDSSYRWNHNRHYNRYRPRYRPGSFRPFYDSWWWRWGNYGDESESEEEPVEEPVEEPEEPEEVPPEPLAVDINMLAKQNQEAHHTADFAEEDLFAVRRGQVFTVKVTVNRKYNKSKDHLVLIFSVGKTPQGSKNTMERIDVAHDKSAEDKPSKWYAVTTSIEPTGHSSSEIVVDVKPAADCIVANYKLEVICYRKEGGKQTEAHKIVEKSVYILFNAWCKDDQVYMEDEDERNEYVLNETGGIFRGNSRWIGLKSWNFGQFSEAAIRAAFYLLQNSKVDIKLHGNATYVARALSAMVNVQDDNGVLVGNWSGEYDDGTSPSAWAGSVKILEEFMVTKRPVQYGQCWVFSGIVTTLGRSLGIPTRSVTNFSSAHDTDKSLTIDYHTDSEGEPLNYLNGDSVWNFHVWNEGWFKRADLPDGYDGWQAFDATPQERSDGTMQCGPAPLKAIKEGNVYLGYDAGFIYAEVNGNRMTWEVSRRGKFKIIKVDSKSVGVKISTKAVGSKDRNDVTMEYKYPEGSPQEAEANNRAYKHSNSDRREMILEYMAEHHVEDVDFSCKDETLDNGDIIINIEAKNTATSRREFPLTIVAFASHYTGFAREELSREKVSVSLEPNQTIEKTWSLKGSDYLDEIDEDAMIKVSVEAKVKPTRQIFMWDESFPLKKPDLDMTVSNERPKVGEEISVTMSFTNPLELQLNKATLTMEGPGMTKERIMELDPVGKGEKFTKTVKITPRIKGKRGLVAVFNSRQLVEVSGVVMIDVQPA